MPVAISLAGGRRILVGRLSEGGYSGGEKLFSLGRWGTAVNALAVLWIAFAIVLFCMPAVVPVTKVSMSECFACRSLK